MRRFWIVLLTLMALLNAGRTDADVLKLENGDVISGTIVTMNGETVTIETVYGTVVVKRSFVVEGSFTGGSELPRSGLVAEVSFDDGYRDTSGMGRAVENPTGVAPSLHNDSETDHYFASDGSGQFVIIHDGGDLGSLQAFSISFSVIIVDEEKSQYIVSKWNQSSGTTADGKFALNYRSGVLSLYIVGIDGTYHLMQHRQAFPTGTWTTVAITFTPEKISVYLNGRIALEEEKLVDGFFSDTNPIYLMTAPASTDNRYGYYNARGGIDDFRFFNRELTAEEIAPLAANR